jgi:hypothetical protein
LDTYRALEVWKMGDVEKCGLVTSVPGRRCFGIYQVDERDGKTVQCRNAFLGRCAYAIPRLSAGVTITAKCSLRHDSQCTQKRRIRK